MKDYEFTSENSLRSISPKIFRNIDRKAFIVRNFPALGHSMSSKISKDKKDEYVKFIRENFSNFSQREIARKLGIGKTSVNRWSEEIGLKFHKHTVNESFFDNLNEESSYILGLIFADGNVTYDPKKHYCLTITASEKDAHHLEKIRKLLSSSKPLLYATKTKSYRLIVNNKHIIKRLMSLGVIPRKSLIVEFPNIPKEQIRHFIRGVIDGDGTVRYLQRKRSPYFEISLCSGSLKFCEGFVKTIKEEVGIDANIRKIGDHCYSIQYSCNRGKLLAKYIYSDSAIFLNRKYDKYKEHVLEAKK
jgi:hypothetical protein